MGISLATVCCFPSLLRRVVACEFFFCSSFSPFGRSGLGFGGCEIGNCRRLGEGEEVIGEEESEKVRREERKKKGRNSKKTAENINTEKLETDKSKIKKL